MEWELTEKEIEGIYIEATNNYPFTRALLWKVWLMIRDAQAKKLVEWLDGEDRLIHITDFGGNCWEECMICELHRQVGLE